MLMILPAAAMLILVADPSLGDATAPVVEGRVTDYDPAALQLEKDGKKYGCGGQVSYDTIDITYIKCQ